MAKKDKVTDDELVSMIQGEVVNVRTESFDLISDQRIDSNYANTYLNTSGTRPTTGMSGSKFFFTPGACKTLTMNLSRVFCSDKETLKLTPMMKTPESQAAAMQLEKAVNTVIHRENDGFSIISSMLQSAAWNKNGIAKVTWNDYRIAFEEVYTDIDSTALQQIVMMKEQEGYEVEVTAEEVVELEQVTVFIDEITGVEEEEIVEADSGTYTLRLSKVEGRIDIDVIPPEDFLINEETTDIHNDELTRFVGHKRHMYRGDIKDLLKSLGVKDVDVEELKGFDSINDEYEKRARHDFDGTLESYNESDETGGPSSKVEIVETWIRADRDGDGYAEWRHCYVAGATLIHDEEWYGPLPFTSYTFFPVPHKFYGQSVYDILHDYEEQATGLFRSDMDMARLKNTYRIFAKEGVVDRRTLQSGKPGVIPVSNQFTADSVMEVPTPVGASNTALLMAEIRQQVIAEIGIDPITGQISPDIQKSGNDASKTMMALDNASIKIEGYSRRFADGPLRDICWLISLEMVRRKDTKFVQDIIQSIDPEIPFLAGELGMDNMIRRVDFVSKVGLGHQTGQQKIAAGTLVSQMLAQLAQQPNAAMYNLATETLRGHGYEDPVAIMGPLEYWVQKEQMMTQQLQSQMAAQQAQAQTAAAGIQMQQQQLQFQQQMEAAKHEREEARKDAESKAKIASDMASAGLDDAKTQEILSQIGQPAPPPPPDASIG